MTGSPDACILQRKLTFSLITGDAVAAVPSMID